MATGTAQRGPQATPPARKSEGRWLEYDQFIDTQLRKARGQVKSVELVGSLMTLVAGGLLYFLAVSLVDHWMFTGGLGIGGRLFFFALFIASAAWYIGRRLVPLVIMRINPIYAAETIEKSKPSLKNSLINFLFLRSERSGVPQVIYQAVEEQAASNLQRTPVEATVDRTKLIQIGYVLLAAVALFAAYKLFSPKDPIDTVGRIVMPWADIQAPTRVTILDVQPGSRVAYLGEAVEISAELRGIDADEPVRILYTTGDRQTVDQAVTMHRAADAFRHTGKIPAGESGLQQDIEYRIEAGDAISPTYMLQAAAAPTIAVESIDYEFPAYTGKGKSHVENAGDIQAIEGTRVTIHGHPNQPLKSAQLVLDGQGRHLEPDMKIEGRSVTATIVLALDEKDRAAPQFSRYQLRPNGRLKPEPAQYKIDVFPDLAPEISFLAPENDEVAVPVNGSLPLEVRAVDPDFALSEVTLSAEVGEKSLIDKKLLSGNHSGPFVKKFLFEPTKLGLKEGDSVNYWATAKDNRAPEANEAHTKHRQIRIVKAELRRPSAGPPPKEPNKNPPDQNQPQENQPNDQPGQDRNPKERNDNQPRGDQDRNNPDIKQQNPDDGGNRENPKQDKPPENGEQQQQGDNKQGDNKQGDKKEGDNKQGDKKEGDNKQQPNGNPDKPDKQGAAGQQGSKQSGGGGNEQKQESGDKGSGGAEKKTSSGNSGGKPSSGEQSKDSSSNGQPSGERNDGHGAQGQPQPNAGQSGNPQSGPSAGNEQSSPSDTAQDWKALKDALDKQDRDGAGRSGQSSDKQPGAQGAQGSSQDKKSGGDHAADGSSPNPSTDPRGSGGPFPNGKPGTGGKANDKPAGDKSGHQPGNSKQQPGDKADGPRSSGDHQNRDKPSGDKNAADKPNGDKNAADKPNGDQKSDGGDKPTGEKSTGDKPAGEKPNGSQSPMGDKSHGENSQSAGQPKPGDKPSGNPQPGDKSKSGGEPQTGQKGEQGAKPPTDKSSTPNGSKTEAGDKASPDKKNSNAEHGENKSGVNDPSKQGDGAQAKQGSQPSDKKTEQPDGGAKQNSDAKGGDPQTPKGSPSAGQKSTDDKGSPSPQEGSKPNEQKTDSPGSPKESDSPDNAKSPSNSPKESNSQGPQEGDRSGNGGKGGGQTSKNPGTGGAGSSTAADEGKGASKGAGKGDDSNKPGTDKQSDKPTGQPGDKKGAGSNPSDKPADEGKTSNQPGGDKPGGGGADSGFGGNRTGELPDGGPPDTSPINGDEANKEFAKRQFDLALDKLKKGNPDLLKELNWSADDARKLAERLEQMKAAAKKDPQGDAAKRMDDLVRSLGSRAGQLTRRGDGANDKQHGLLESNNSGPPADYLDQFEAFQQGTLRGGK